MNMKMDAAELKAFLDEKVLLYNNPDFIDSDPIQFRIALLKKKI
tara:strand:- start:198 stop:329 length:132 start_codon:yes stop_codon:yes gene_type:complete